MVQPISNRKLSYRRDIDGLRAIAVLSVIGYHLSPGRIRGGFVGVDIFFVISGFLISSIIYNELESKSFSIREFYVRRVRRIYPSLFVILAFVCATGWLFLLPTNFVRLGKQIIGGSTFSANFVLWWQSGYFEASPAQSPLLHLWSLGVEEQYYLIFPLICLLFFRSRARWALPASFLAIAVASMAINIACVTRFSSATFFLPFSRLWELFLGAGLSLAVHRNLQAPWEERFFSRWRDAIGFVGLAILLISIFGINEYDAFPGWWALLPTVGTALVIAAGESAWSNRHILSLEPAVFVGLISYPLYLWHWPILSLVATQGDLLHLPLPARFVSPFLKAVVVVLSFLLAYLTYRFIEFPIRRAGQRNNRWKGALWLVFCVSMTGLFGVVVVLKHGFPERMPSALVALDHDYDADAALQDPGKHCFLDAGESAAAFSSNCVDSEDKSGLRPLILLWGDSHAHDLMPGFRTMQSNSGVRLGEYTASLCPPIWKLSLPERPACQSINNAVMASIRSLKPEVVVLSGYWDFYLDHNRAECARKLSQTVEELKTVGVRKVVLVGAAPVWVKEVPELLQDQVHRSPNAPVPGSLPRTLLQPHDDAVLKQAAQQSGAVYIPLFDDLCDPAGCIVTTGQGWQDLLTLDKAHFTAHGSDWVARRIWNEILP